MNPLAVISSLQPSLATMFHGGLLAQAPVSWKPFLTPMPIWDYWMWLLIPLSLGVAVVYKATKCATAAQVPKEAAILFAEIVLGMFAAAAVVALVVRYN